MIDPSVVNKLRLNTINQVLVLNSPEGYTDFLTSIPQSVEILEQPRGKHQFVHLFVKDSREFHRMIQQAVDAVEYDGLFWLSYPKKTGGIESDLSRDIVWKLMEGTGLRPVTQVSINETWSALRFRPAELVGK